MALLLLVACHSRGLFRELSYPIAVTPVPGQDRYHLLGMELRGVLLTDYDQPSLATECVDRLITESPPVRHALAVAARCATQADRSGCAPSDPLLPWPPAVTIWEETLARCPLALGPDDRVRIVDASLAAAATGGRWMVSDLGLPFPIVDPPAEGPTCSDKLTPRPVRELFCGLETAAGGARALESLALDGRSEHPALVLSGGSANGAFSAGYVYELLRLREAALTWYEADPIRLASLHEEARISSVVSTSVGTLVALPVDRYFVADSLAGEAGRVGRAWALDTLRKRFVAEEGDLLCARSWDPFELLTHTGEPLDSLLDFQPLEAMIRQEMFSDGMSSQLIEGGPVRVALSVDARTALTAVADERACRGTSEALVRDCLVKQVMASISLPVFARGVSGTVAVGLPAPPPGASGDPGHNGLYFDGGIKSGTPAVSALGHTRRRILAISNHRLSGAPRLDLDGIDKLAFRSIDLFTDVVREREIEQAELLLHERDLRRAGLARRFGVVWEEQQDPGVLSVHLPADAHPEIGAEGYTFDPAIMVALFRWGQRTLLQNATAVYRHLGGGWSLVPAAPSFSAEVARRLAWVKADMAERDNGWTDPSWRASHQVQRKRALPDQMSLCPASGSSPHAWAIPSVDHDPTYAPEEDE